MYNGDADDDDDVQEVDDKVQQIRSQLSELATQNETLRRDFQALSATCRHTEVNLVILNVVDTHMHTQMLTCTECVWKN